MIIKTGKANRGDSGGGPAAVTYPLGHRDAEARTREVEPRVLVGNPAFMLSLVEASRLKAGCTHLMWAEPAGVKDDKLLRTVTRLLHQLFGARPIREFCFVAYVHQRVVPPKGEPPEPSLEDRHVLLVGAKRHG